MLCYILAIGGNLNAQTETKTKIVELDFNTKLITMPPKEELNNIKFVQIKIINLPTIKYKVSINKTDSIFNISTPPALFGLISFGDGFTSLLEGLSGYIVRNQVYVLPMPDESLWYDFPFPYNISDSNINETLVEVLMKTIKDMRKYIFDFHFKFRDEIIKKADKLIYQYNLGVADTVPFRSVAEKLICKRLELEKEFENKFMLYYDSILPNYGIIINHPSLAKADSILSVYKKGFSQYLNKFDTIFNELLIAKIYNQLAQPKEFISLPYTINSNITKFVIDITGIDATKSLQSYNTIIELNKHPDRLWAFTTGVFVSGLKNYDYSILTNVQANTSNLTKLDTIHYSIIKEENNEVSAGINALMHIGGYFGDSNEIGSFVAFGPGLTLEKNPQVRILLGAGVLFGRHNKIALSFGWSGGPVKRISGNYNLNDKYYPAPSDITRDQFKGSWFFSIGCAFLGK